MTHPSLHLNEQFHFYFLLTEVCLPILNIPYSESYFDFSAKSLATEYWTGELSPDRRVHGSRPKKRGNCIALGIGSLKEMRLNSITTYLDGISQPNITLKVHSTLMSNWNFFNTELHNVGKHIIYVLINLIYFLKSKCKNMLSAF
jgi:hypothetical protein